MEDPARQDPDSTQVSGLGPGPTFPALPFLHLLIHATGLDRASTQEQSDRTKTSCSP